MRVDGGLRDMRYRLTVRWHWQISRNIYRWDSDSEQIAEQIQSALRRLHHILACSYARVGGRDTVELTAEVAEFRDDERRINERLLDAASATINDAVSRFGDQFERAVGSTSLRFEIWSLVPRYTRQKTTAGRPPMPPTSRSPSEHGCRRQLTTRLAYPGTYAQHWMITSILAAVRPLAK
jgi:Fe-S-cluster formation regulator IscX/YfhJ